MEINESNVVEAVRQFYTTSDENLRRQLNGWLTEVQSSAAVWSFAWNLLQSTNDVSVQHFAANCLHRKLSSGDVGEFLKTIGNVEAPDEFLRDSLLLRCSQAQSNLVRNKLASALAAYVVYSTPDIWPDALEDISTLWKSRMPAILLDVFGSIPLECTGMLMAIERRTAVRGALRSRVATVATTISDLIRVHSTNGEIVGLALKCVESWIDFGVDASEWLAIVGTCLQFVPTVSEEATSAISKFFCRFIENSELRKMENFLGQLFDFFASLFSQRPDLESNECVMEMCLALMEHQSNFLLRQLNSRDSPRILVQFALSKATNARGFYPIDESISAQAFSIWYNLYEDASMEQDDAVRVASLKIIEPIYAQLSKILLRKLKYPPQEIYNRWSAEDKEHFEKYRSDGADIFACCYRILISTDFLDALVGEEFQNASSTLLSSNGRIWEDSEVVLYALECVGDYVSGEHARLRNFLERGLAIIPFSDPILVNTTLRMVAKYAVLICDDTAMLKPILDALVLRFLNDQSTVYNATIVLESLCRNGDAILFNDQPLCLSIISSASKCFGDTQFQKGDRLCALSAIGYVLSTQPSELIMSYLNEFLAPRLQRLHEVVGGKTAPCTKEELLMEFDVLTCLISALGFGITRRSNVGGCEANSPVYLVVSQSFGLFENIYAASGGDADVAKKIVDTLKRALGNLSDQSKDLVPQFCRVLQLLYPPHAVALDLSKPLFLLFATDSLSTPSMVALFNSLSERTASLEHGDGVEEFLGLCYQLAKKQRNFLLNVPASCLERSVVIAYQAIGNRVSDSSTVRQSSSFLCELFSNAGHATINGLVEKYASAFMTACFERLQVELLGSCVEYVADVIFALIKFNQNTENLLRHQNFARFSSPLISAMMKEVGNKRKFREYAKQYNFNCKKEAQKCSMRNIL